MSSLLGPLGREKSEIMSELLESVSTDKLEVQFKKYLPAVLNETTKPKFRNRKRSLNESLVEKNGNRAQSVAQDNGPASDEADLLDLRRLAGLN
jgi:hypothetical protein